VRFVIVFVAMALYPPCSLSAAEADVSEEVETIRKQFDVPGLGAIVFRSNKVLAMGAAGVRKRGDETKFTKEDKVHLGSLTKSMTATLVALVVEEGKIGWDTTVSDVFGKAGVDAGFHEVTLRTLMRHRGGLPSSTMGDAWGMLMRREGSERKQRERLVRGALDMKPAYDPGSKLQYANLNFVVAGAMLERVMNQSYEELIEARLFQELAMTSVGFGPQASPQEVDQPWGHVPDGTAIAPEAPGSDNPPALAPAGTAHCVLKDLARYGAFHLGRSETTRLKLSKKNFAVLHGDDNDPKDSYGLGWIRASRSWAEGMALTHRGTNTMHMAQIWLALSKDFGVAVASNQGGTAASQACDQMVTLLIERFATSFKGVE
jgi:D-alanyl-D-alanine carboxypeptidase